MDARLFLQKNDDSGDGFLDKQETVAALTVAFPNSSPSEIIRLMMEADARGDNDGQLGAEELFDLSERCNLGLVLPEPTERIAAWYSAYGKAAKATPENVHFVASKYFGREAELFARLKSMYGPEPPVDPQSSARAAAAAFHNTVRAYYQLHNPAKMADVPGICSKYQNNQKQLFDLLAKKYGPRPSTDMVLRAQKEAEMGGKKLSLVSIQLKSVDDYEFCKVHDSHVKAIAAETGGLVEANYMMTTDVHAVVLLTYSTRDGVLEQRYAPLHVPAGFLCNGVSGPLPQAVREWWSETQHTSGWILHDWLYATFLKDASTYGVNEAADVHGAFLENFFVRYTDPASGKCTFNKKVVRLDCGGAPAHVVDQCRRAADVVLIEPLRTNLAKMFASGACGLLDYFFAVPGGTTPEGRKMSTIAAANFRPAGSPPVPDDVRSHFVSLDFDAIKQHAVEHFTCKELDRVDVKIPSDSEKTASQRRAVASSVGLQFHRVGQTAEDDTAALRGSQPPQLMQASDSMIQEALGVVYAAFPSGGPAAKLAEQQETAELLGLLGLGGNNFFSAPVLQRIAATYGGGTVGGFCDAAVQAIRNFHPAIVHFLAEVFLFKQRNSGGADGLLPQDTAARRKDIRQAVCWSAILDAATHVLMFQDPASSNGGLLGALVAHFQNRRKSPQLGDWKKHFSVFGRAKIPSVCIPVEKTTFLPSKRGEPLSKFAAGGTVLAVNILEATVSDISKGHDGNAALGYELMLESNKRDDETDGLNNKPTRVDRATGVVHIYPSLPRAWSNLYVAWNLAFVSVYENWPLFAAKLLFPSILSHYNKPSPSEQGTFIHLRALSLWLHIQLCIGQRATTDWRTQQSATNWSRTELTSLFGHVNEQAGKNYHKRVEAAIDDNNSIFTELAYDLRRGKSRLMFAPIKALVRTATAVGERSRALKQVVKQIMAMVVDSDDVSEVDLAMDDDEFV